MISLKQLDKRIEERIRRAIGRRGEIVLATCLCAFGVSWAAYEINDAVERGRRYTAALEVVNYEHCVDRFRESTKPHRLPHSLEELVARTALSRVSADPWGNRYAYLIKPGPDHDFVIVSAGPDERLGTTDDISNVANHDHRRQEDGSVWLTNFNDR